MSVGKVPQVRILNTLDEAFAWSLSHAKPSAAQRLTYVQACIIECKLLRLDSLLAERWI
jgi:hypothetical protein